MIDHRRRRRRVGSSPSSSVVLLLLLPSVLLLVRRSHRSSVVAASSVEGALGGSADAAEVPASLRRRLLLNRHDEDDIDEESFSAATSPLLGRLGNLRLEINPKLLRLDPVFSRRGGSWGDDDDGDDDELRDRVLDALRRRRENKNGSRNLQDGDGGEEGDDGDPDGSDGGDGPAAGDQEVEEVECAVDARFDFVYKHALEMGETAYRALTGPPLYVDRMAYVYKAYVDRDGRDEYFGYAAGDDDDGGGEEGEDGDDRAAGRNNELTGAMRSNHERATFFWDRASREGLDSNGENEFDYSGGGGRTSPSVETTNDVVLLGLHGSDLSVRSNVVESVKIMYAYAWGDEPDGHGDGDGKLTDDEATDVAESIMELIEGSLPGGYDNPMLTFRATALSGGTYEALIVEDGGVDDMDGGVMEDLVIPDTIAIGDGFLRFISESAETTTTGEEDGGAAETAKMLAGPLFAHAHEYAHHVHFELVPEEEEFSDLLRVELLADALGSYYLAHPDGGGWMMIAGDDDDGDEVEEEIQDGEQLDRAAPLLVKSLGDAASVLGDCDVDGTNHHGTPEQRRCAALWGARNAMTAEGPGTYYHPEALRSMFDEELGAILSLDAEACGSGFDWNAAAPGEEEGNVNSTSLPSSAPSAGPTTPSPTASLAPSSDPSSAPTPPPTVSAVPSSVPSEFPSGAPTASAPPSSEPSGGPSLSPTSSARPSTSFSPSGSPSSVPSDAPTVVIPTAPIPTSTPSSPPAEGDSTVAPSPPNGDDSDPPPNSSDPERGSSVSARSSGAGLARHRLVASAAAAAAALAIALWS